MIISLNVSVEHSENVKHFIKYVFILLVIISIAAVFKLIKKNKHAIVL